MTLPTPVPTADDLRRAFATPTPPTVGLEEEVLLLDPVTLDLLPRGAEVLAAADGDPALKGELPAAQLELVTPPRRTVAEAAADLAAARARLVDAVAGQALVTAVGIHPTTNPEGVLVDTARGRQMREAYGRVAALQLVSGLHVHVAVRPVEVAVAVHDALRSHLPDLAALAANSPFLGGSDTGLASARPMVSGLLPRQGVPPALHSVEGLAAELAWGAATGVLLDARQWWWELRVHPVLGTLEVRVCDAQTALGDVTALAALIHALSVHLAARAAAGDLPPPAPTWRVAENRWSACRDGVTGTMTDPHTGRREATRDRLHGLLDAVHPTAEDLGCADELAGIARLLVDPAPARHRRLVAEGGPSALLRWLVGRFTPTPQG